MNDERAYEEQNAIFERLYVRMQNLLGRFGRPDSLQHGDFSIYGDYWGYPQLKISIHDLTLLRPEIVTQMQEVVRDFPGWEIVVAVAVRGHYEDWPDMGLYIRPREIIDGLQRQYFPKEFQDIRYKGGRLGTDLD